MEQKALIYERFTAIDSAQVDEDPSRTWYEEELKFFDSFVIPLAQKLESCGVSGLESLELLNHAQDNRQKWGVEESDMLKNWRLRYYKKKLEMNALLGEQSEAIFTERLMCSSLSSLASLACEHWLRTAASDATSGTPIPRCR